MSADPRDTRHFAVQLAYDAVARVSFAAGTIVLLAAVATAVLAVVGGTPALAAHGLLISLALALGSLVLLLAGAGAQWKAKRHARVTRARAEDA